MSSYVVGDIQGCFDEFIALLSLFDFSPSKDKVYLVGDLVNRGPKSLEVLSYAYANQDSVQLVLGNHDLHLLACWAGVVKPKPQDTMTEILAYSEVDLLLHWLRKQPLLIELEDQIIVHAGLNPNLSFVQNKNLASFCSNKLAGDNYKYWLSVMYGNTPSFWSNDMTEEESFRLGVNSFTRMRMMNGKSLDMKFKGSPENCTSLLKPWFEMPIEACKCIVFGHWSALGLVVSPSYIALDTGCIWGGQLTAVCLDDMSLYQYPSLQSLNIVGQE